MNVFLGDLLYKKMSLNKLVGGDCGGNNTLVQLSNIVVRDAPLSQAPTQVDSFINEFVSQQYQPPQTFNMNALLQNIPAVEKSSNQSNKPATFHSSQIQHNMPMAWTAGPSTSHMPSQFIMRPLPQQFVQPHSSSNVKIEYINESELEVSENNVQKKAHEYVNSVKEDDELAYNQFMSFMKKVSAGELNLGDPTTVQDSQKRMSKDEILDEMTEKYKDEWDKLSNIHDFWDSEAANGISEKYDFTEGNVMLENKSALEIGKEKLKMGDIPGAVLCFEAAVQQVPHSAEAWFLLGTTQAENEQDPLAITALKKSLEIDPTQLDAYITLAAAYTNENMPKYAFISLINWLKASKYSDLLPQDIDPKKMDLKQLENHVKTLFLKAVQLNTSVIDPDVQNALGVVFNISQEYDKAVDCFKTALMVASDDPKLWNRLGATLANSDRSEEAVNAYHEALELEPGFIRARYNVGITCMNLGAHKQAAEHFIMALNQQNKAKSMYPESSSTDVTSSSIWTTLRMVCSFLGPQVVILADSRDLDELNRYFDTD